MYAELKRSSSTKQPLSKSFVQSATLFNIRTKTVGQKESKEEEEEEFIQQMQQLQLAF